jgi:hypothetical protein
MFSNKFEFKMLAFYGALLFTCIGYAMNFYVTVKSRNSCPPYLKFFFRNTILY